MIILSKYKKYILSALMLISVSCGSLLLNSCSDEFLEPTPLSFYEPGVTLSSESGMQAVMAMVDRHLRHYWTFHENNTGYNSNPLATEYLFSDLSAYGKTDVAQNSENVNIAASLTPTSGAGGPGITDGNMIRYFWEETYNGMKYANTIINYIDAVKGLSDEVKNGYLGRAYFHRAYRYLTLIYQYGDVPLITTIPSVPKFNYRSTSKEAILELMTKDMEFAVQWVPDQKDMAYKGMVNKGACRMLLAKCYLSTGQWQKAKDQLDILIDQSGYSLMQNTFGTFVQGGEAKTWPITRNVIWDLHRSENKLHANNTEGIMVMPNRGLAGESFRSWVSMRIYGPMWNSTDIRTIDGQQAVLNTPRNNSAYNVEQDFARALGRGIATVRLTQFAQTGLWVVNGVEDEVDLRHNSEVGNWGKMTNIRVNNRASAYYGQGLVRFHPTTGAALCNDTVRCWFDWPHYKIWALDVGAEANMASTNFNGATPGSTGGHNDFYLYRLAEAYLLRAEVKFYMGDVAGATNDVNEVRKRAKASQLYTTVNIGDIVNERARELYLEEWRNVELSRISRCLALSGKPDEWGNTYDIKTYDKQEGTDKAGGSYWWQRIVHYNEFYNSPHNPIKANSRSFNYTLDKRNFYWPIHNSALTANNEGKLSQNYGYPGYDASTPIWTTWEEAVADEYKTTD